VFFGHATRNGKAEAGALPFVLVVKNVSQTFSRCAGGIPVPVSVILMITASTSPDREPELMRRQFAALRHRITRVSQQQQVRDEIRHM